MASSLAVILLNYKRPQNIGVIVDAAREALPEAPILVFDQAEADGLRDRTDVRWSEVWLSRAETNRGAGVRVPMAAGLPFAHYLAIDDDVFLTATQIGELARRLLAEPDRAHGIWGQRLHDKDGAIGIRNFIREVDAPVSILNRVYAFSREQAQAAIDLAGRIGFGDWDQAGPVDDILLSCASVKPPLCHDLGDIADCPTSNQRGIAVWREPGFADRRASVIERLVADGVLAVYSQPADRAG